MNIFDLFSNERVKRYLWNRDISGTVNPAVLMLVYTIIL